MAINTGDDNNNRINKYDRYNKFKINSFNFDKFHGFNMIKNRNNGNENIPSELIGDKANEIPKAQKRSNKDGIVIHSGSGDFGMSNLSDMSNVNSNGNSGDL